MATFRQLALLVDPYVVRMGGVFLAAFHPDVSHSFTRIAVVVAFCLRRSVVGAK